MAKRWWRKRMMRIYHPNPSEYQLRDLDVRHFVADCVMTNAEAIVISAGGIYAFYPSQVPYHHVGEPAKDRDLLGEITSEAQAQGLKVIARVDFSKAREDVWQAHPEWFQRRTDGETVRAGAYYVTCPLGGYQNEAFAHPVMREILSTYPVAGFHVNAAGFHGFCACPSCAEAFGEPIPSGPDADPAAWRRFLRWRGQAIGRQFTAYYDLLHEIDDNALLMAEFTGPENPEWALAAGQHLPSLSHAFTQVLLTAGGMREARRSRYWVAMAADQARAVRRKRNPLINVKPQMRDTGHPQGLMPLGEFAHACYQALAHGAGLKIPTFGTPSDQPDPRTMPAIAEVFAFMRQQQRVIDTMEPISHVTLIWPEEGLLMAADPAALRDEFVGLYEALKSRHVLLSVLYDEAITTKTLRADETVVLPAGAWLDADRATLVADFVRRGGRLVLVDGPWEPASAITGSLAEPLASLVGGDAGETMDPGDVSFGHCRYALPTPQLPPRLLARLGPLPLSLPYRRMGPAPEATVWLRNGLADDALVPEDLAALRPGQDALLARIPVGEGIISYVAFPLGREYLASGHPDLPMLLEAVLLEGSPLKPFLLTDAPSGVEVTLAHWEQGVVVHLVNACGPAPLDRPAPVGPITLDLAWDGPAQAELCAPGASPQALPCEEAWNRVRVVVPRVEAYAQVVVRSA